MQISANDIRQGNVIEYNSKLCTVAKQPDHTKPGKGGAFVQVELKDLRTGTKHNVRFRSTENVEKVRLDQDEYQFLYLESDKIILMNNTSFEQRELNQEILGDEKIKYLTDGMMVTLEKHEDEVINITLPETVTVIVQEAEPVVKGQTATASYKPAMLENGIRIMVPPFVETGDKLIVKTEDNSYVERAK